MAQYDEYKYNEGQTVYGWTGSFDMTEKGSPISKRQFNTLEGALEYINDPNSSAIPGLILSVVNDTDENNGAYRVSSINECKTFGGEPVLGNLVKLADEETVKSINNSIEAVDSKVKRIIRGAEVQANGGKGDNPIQIVSPGGLDLTTIDIDDIDQRRVSGLTEDISAINEHIDFVSGSIKTIVCDEETIHQEFDEDGNSVLGVKEITQSAVSGLVETISDIKSDIVTLYDGQKNNGIVFAASLNNLDKRLHTVEVLLEKIITLNNLNVGEEE